MYICRWVSLSIQRMKSTQFYERTRIFLMAERYEKVRETASGFFYTITGHIQLLPFLYEVFSNRSRNSVKSILRRGQVYVNDVETTQFNDELRPGDTVYIEKNRSAKRKASLDGVKILFEDQDLIVIHKDAGLLSIATEKERLATAYAELTAYVKQQNPHNRIFIVHRLDRETSGVMMFAKNEETKRKLQTHWQKLIKKRHYLALVEGEVTASKDQIVSYLKEDQGYRVYSVSKEQGGKRAVTHFEKRKTNVNYTLLDVYLETGRKNQIRVHLSDIGHPVTGDRKYGAKYNPLKRLGLHAQTIAFIHPNTKKFHKITARPPKRMLQIV